MSNFVCANTTTNFDNNTIYENNNTIITHINSTIQNNNKKINSNNTINSNINKNENISNDYNQNISKNINNSKILFEDQKNKQNITKLNEHNINNNLVYTNDYLSSDTFFDYFYNSSYYKLDDVINNDSLNQVVFEPVITDYSGIIYAPANNNNIPVVTIINTTEVRDNQQNIKITGNIAGTIYYTRNGTTPTTTNGRIYTGGELSISIKTQIKAILITNNGISSSICFYQAPSIVTPPVSIIIPSGFYQNRQQLISFKSNRACTIYYTLDNSNPRNSNNNRYSTNDGVNFYLGKNIPLKYFSIDSDGYASEVYTYTTPIKNIRPEIKVFNTTRVYSNNQQRVMIQTNLPGTIYYTTDGSMPTKSSTSFSNEFTISKLTQLNIFSTSTNNKISSFNQYMTDSGTKTVNNYTYIIKIPNTPIKYIEIIKNANSTYATGYTLYDFNTKTITHPTSTNINKPGILIYTDNTGYIIKYYDYTYNNTNQVNAIFTKGIFGSERIHMKNNDQNNSIIIQITYGTSQIQKEEITTTFTSNLQDTITRHETIGYGLDHNSNYGFEILQTYLITNEMITQNIMQSWTNKTYSEGVEKARYGTFLTGLTTLWLNDETAQVYAKHLNLTIVKGRDTQLLVGIQNDGTSYINIPDPRLGITVVNTQSNITKTFTLITTLTVSECERIALRLSGQNITSTLAQIYQDYIYNNQNLIITFDNSTGQATLNTQNNNNSEIIIDMKTGITKTIIKDNKNIYKGAISQPGTGYCYHSTRTDGLNDWLNKIPTLNEYDQEMLYYLEDLGGGIFITAGLLLACSGGSVIIGGLAVTLGIGMCLQAAGANSLDDIANPYCWAGAAPTILASTIPFTSSLRITAKSIIAGTRISTNIGLKSTIIISAGEESIKRYDKQLESYITGSVISENLKSALRYLKVPGEENLRKVMVYG